MKRYCCAARNFDDLPLNTCLWPQLLPTQLCPESKTLPVGIVSLLNGQLPRLPLKAIVSSGVGYGRVQPNAGWRLYRVRGPDSAQVLGLDPQTATTDGAAQVRTLGLSGPPKSLRVAFMPHRCNDYHGDWRGVCQAAGNYFIDPAANVLQMH